MASVTPVQTSASVMIRMPRIIKKTSLPKPANASSVGSKPAMTKKSSTPSPITLAGILSRAKRIIAATTVASTSAICISMQKPSTPFTPRIYTPRHERSRCDAG